MRRTVLSLLAASLGLSGCSGPDGALPAPYRRAPVPDERLQSPAARERGRQLFQERCALCHGERGDGRGARREGFSRPPANFTDPAWRQRMTPRRVYYLIREGVAGTPMPSWKSLEPDETWDLVAFVLSLRSGAE